MNAEKSFKALVKSARMRLRLAFSVNLIAELTVMFAVQVSESTVAATMKRGLKRWCCCYPSMTSSG